MVRDDGSSAVAYRLNCPISQAIRDPVGVGSCITLWNFPIALPAWEMFPALVAGNTMVFKLASATPDSSLQLDEILHKAGSTVGETLVHQPDVSVISFTGATHQGAT